MTHRIEHDDDELRGVALRVLRDIEDPADTVRLAKLVQRACRHYHEAMAGQAECETTPVHPAPVPPIVQVASGGYLDLRDPDPEALHLVDIAHALSKLCRYTGHTRSFYSVAQHCVLCAEQAPVAARWSVLMHDAAEAYIGDVSRPLKGLLPDYRAIEARLEAAIAQRFGLDPSHAGIVKRIDLEALATERRDLMPRTGEPWGVIEDVEPWRDTIEPWSPESARMAFENAADRYRHLAVRAAA